MHRKQGGCTVWWRPAWWRNIEIFEIVREVTVLLYLIKQTNKQKPNGTVSVFFLCSSAFYHLCKEKGQLVLTRGNHFSLFKNERLEFLEGIFGACRSLVPPALRLLAGRLPLCWGQCLPGSCGLPPLSAGPLNPWRTWSWRNLGPWDCWR